MDLIVVLSRQIDRIENLVEREAPKTLIRDRIELARECIRRLAKIYYGSH